MNPTYQRHGRLWSVTDKAFLVDSILNEYDIPKIYLADFTFGKIALNKKGLPYAIIDGKQRFESLFEFFENKLLLDSDFIFQINPSLKLGGLGYNDLRNNYPDIADTFDNYPLSVMRVITDNEDNINELFVRLNRSKPLTGAEIRNAMLGPVPSLIRSLVSHDFFKTCIRFTINRGEDKNAAAKLLLFEFEGRMVETKRRNLDQFTIESKSSSNKDKLELSSRRVVDILDQMSEIFLPRDILLASSGILPVYYWFVRHHKSKEYPLIREFLIDFERNRKLNRVNPIDTKLVKSDDFTRFDEFNRNTNDIASHNGRFKILFDSFKKIAQIKK